MKYVVNSGSYIRPTALRKKDEKSNIPLDFEENVPVLLLYTDREIPSVTGNNER